MIIKIADVTQVDDVVKIHLETFKGFFLTFLGRGFLRCLYKGYITHNSSNLLIAVDNEQVIGFLAYSEDLSGFYKYLIKKSILPFTWYSLCAFCKKPSALFRLIRAFSCSTESKRDEKYIQLSSIGVLPTVKNHGTGSFLIKSLINKVEFNMFSYIKLETDAINNDVVNNFYLKNGFMLDHEYETPEGRKMNEYRYYYMYLQEAIF